MRKAEQYRRYSERIANDMSYRRNVAIRAQSEAAYAARCARWSFASGDYATCIYWQRMAAYWSGVARYQLSSGV